MPIAELHRLQVIEERLQPAVVDLFMQGAKPGHVLPVVFAHLEDGEAPFIGTGWDDEVSWLTAKFMELRGWRRLAVFLESQAEWEMALDYYERWTPDGMGCGTYEAGAKLQREDGIERCRKRIGRSG